MMSFDFKAALIGTLLEMELYIWRVWFDIWCHRSNIWRHRSTIWHRPRRPRFHPITYDRSKFCQQFLLGGHCKKRARGSN